MARAARLSLRRVFAPKDIRRIFVKYVWDALRDQNCNDLLAYYDYRRTIDERAEQLALIIAEGNYRPKASLAIAISKADLLARNMHIPHPDDALVMQVVSETLLPLVEKKKPSSNAFFARSHQQHPGGLHTQSQLQIYPWFRLWPLYQERILKFAKTKKYLVVTDIINFFDSVGFSHIRRRVQNEVPQSQQVVDLLLLLFENFIRRDMYAPIVLQGIPTIDVDAPRLIGHGLLFPVDAYLRKRTGKCFARWMDDINFGVDSIREARESIRDIDKILRTVGLRLSGGKTKILSFDDASEYLQARENQRINVFETRLKKSGYKVTTKIASQGLRAHLIFRKKPSHGYWDKVMRRYYRLAGRLNVVVSSKTPGYNTLLRRVENISHVDFANITTSEYREAIVRFWLTLPVTEARLKKYITAFEEVQGYDDAVTFAMGMMFAEVTLTVRQAATLAKMFLKFAKKNMATGCYFSAAWFFAKNANQRDIVEFISSTREQWEANFFFARQAVALWSLLPSTNKSAASLREAFIRTHDPEIRSTLEFLEYLRSVQKPDDSLRGTLPLNRNVKSVDLRRAIISSNVMRSVALDPKTRLALHDRVVELISDRKLRALALGGTAQ